MTGAKELSFQLTQEDLPAIYKLLATHPIHIRRNLAVGCALVIFFGYLLTGSIDLKNLLMGGAMAMSVGLALFWLGGTGWSIPNPNKAAKKRFVDAILQPHTVNWDQTGISSKAPALELNYQWPDIASWRKRGPYMLIYGRNGLIIPIVDGPDKSANELIGLLQANAVKGGNV